MKTLRDKAIGINERAYKINQDGTKEDLGIQASYLHKDVEKHLKKFYESYWKHGKEGDKGKLWISCDQLDYLLDKQFGKLVDIKTLQLLESDEISKDKLYKITLKEEK